jgi:hypothetical protein
MLNSPLLPPPEGSASTVRLTWPDVAVILAAVGFTIFLNLRATPIGAAVAIAGGTMVMFVGLVAIPRSVGEIARCLRALRAAADVDTRRDRP